MAKSKNNSVVITTPTPSEAKKGIKTISPSSIPIVSNCNPDQKDDKKDKKEKKEKKDKVRKTENKEKKITEVTTSSEIPTPVDKKSTKKRKREDTEVPQNQAASETNNKLSRAENKKIPLDSSKSAIRSILRKAKKHTGIKKRYISPIAIPLASPAKACVFLSAIQKATSAKATRRGVKEVAKALRKGERGIVVLAADVFPVDVLAHMPVLCEDTKVPYVFVGSKHEIGAAGKTRRPASAIMLRERRRNQFESQYTECETIVKELKEKIQV